MDRVSALMITHAFAQTSGSMVLRATGKWLTKTHRYSGY